MNEEALETLLQPYLLDGPPAPACLYAQLARYLDLLLKWNARTNLTAIRQPEEIVRRHFGESLFAARELGSCETLLDFGSGAGFPGMPIQLLLPNLRVTLAESQNKKAAFLRELVRTLDVKAEVWAGRVETMPLDASFDVVTLRAVDRMEAAVAAASRIAEKRMLLLTTADQAPPTMPGFTARLAILTPGLNCGQVLCLDRDL